ncbi:MAG TPA: DUF4238 domain-containing protein [Candidatus Saccharimonadales bacterium]|nr:DUF4238 domain-containing protein [Candidatus Saccharimonadales bacterium]
MLAGAERDFYADPTPGGGKDFDTFENILESLEKPANPIFQKLRTSTEIDEEEKTVFTQYIILMMRRVWSSREEMNRRVVQPGSYRPTDHLFTKLNVARTPEAEAYIMETWQRISSTPGFGVQLHNRLAAASPDSFMCAALNKMRWIFYIAPAGYFFVTCDNPVWVSKVGLGKSIAELSFPISTSIALVATWNKHAREGFSIASEQTVKAVNRRTIHSAQKNVFASQIAEWIIKTFDRKQDDFKPFFGMREVYDVVKLVPDVPGSRGKLVWNLR